MIAHPHRPPCAHGCSLPASPPQEDSAHRPQSCSDHSAEALARRIPHLDAMLRRLGFREEVREAAIHVGICAAWRRIRDGRAASMPNRRAWLRKVTIRAAIRLAACWKPLPTLADPVVAVMPGDEIEAADMRRKVRAAVEALPGLQRQAITLRHLDGLSLREAALAANLPEATFRRHLAAGMKRLRTALTSPGADVFSGKC